MWLKLTSLSVDARPLGLVAHLLAACGPTGTFEIAFYGPGGEVAFYGSDDDGLPGIDEACGDGVCEQAEDCLGCEVDCGPCLPETVGRPFDCGAGNTVVKTSGPASNRVNFVIAGEGYTESELDTAYAAQVQTLLDAMDQGETAAPYPTYRRFINVCRLNVVSPESGVDLPDRKIEVETAFDGLCGEDGDSMDGTLVHAALNERLAGTDLDPDWIGVIVNTDTYCGVSYGYFMMWGGAHEWTVDTGLHEAAHSFHWLADEYGDAKGRTYSGSEPADCNVTADSSGAKWDRWLGFRQELIGEIGTYEGGMYTDSGIWRPSEDSRMRTIWNELPLNVVGIEAAIQDIYDIVRPIDAFTDNSVSLTSPKTLSVRVVDPEVLTIDWSVDGSVALADGPETVRLAELGLTDGRHEIGVRVYDETPWIRLDRERLEQTVTWDVHWGDDPSGGETASSVAASEATCSGVLWEDICWYLSKPGENCIATCESHGGVENAARGMIGSREEGGSPRGCTQVMTLLGRSGHAEAHNCIPYEEAGCFIYLDSEYGERIIWCSEPNLDSAFEESECSSACGCQQ